MKKMTKLTTAEYMFSQFGFHMVDNNSRWLSVEERKYISFWSMWGREFAELTEAQQQEVLYNCINGNVVYNEHRTAGSCYQFSLEDNFRMWRNQKAGVSYNLPELMGDEDNECFRVDEWILGQVGGRACDRFWEIRDHVWEWINKISHVTPDGHYLPSISQSLELYALAKGDEKVMTGIQAKYTKGEPGMYFAGSQERLCWVLQKAPQEQRPILLAEISAYGEKAVDWLSSCFVGEVIPFKAENTRKALEYMASVEEFLGMDNLYELGWMRLYDLEEDLRRRFA